MDTATKLLIRHAESLIGDNADIDETVDGTLILRSPIGTATIDRATGQPRLVAGSAVYTVTGDRVSREFPATDHVRLAIGAADRAIAHASGAGHTEAVADLKAARDALLRAQATLNR